MSTYILCETFDRSQIIGLFRTSSLIDHLKSKLSHTLECMITHCFTTLQVDGTPCSPSILTLRKVPLSHAILEDLSFCAYETTSQGLNLTFSKKNFVQTCQKFGISISFPIFDLLDSKSHLKNSEITLPWSEYIQMISGSHEFVYYVYDTDSDYEMRFYFQDMMSFLLSCISKPTTIEDELDDLFCNITKGQLDDMSDDAYLNFSLTLQRLGSTPSVDLSQLEYGKKLRMLTQMWADAGKNRKIFDVKLDPEPDFDSFQELN